MARKGVCCGEAGWEGDVAPPYFGIEKSEREIHTHAVKQRERKEGYYIISTFFPPPLKSNVLSDRLLSPRENDKSIPNSTACVLFGEHTVYCIQHKTPNSLRHCRNVVLHPKHFVLHTKIRYSAERNTKINPLQYREAAT